MHFILFRFLSIVRTALQSGDQRKRPVWTRTGLLFQAQPSGCGCKHWQLTITGVSECNRTGRIVKRQPVLEVAIPSPTRPCGRRRKASSAGLFDPHILYLDRKGWLGIPSCSCCSRWPFSAPTQQAHDGSVIQWRFSLSRSWPGQCHNPSRRVAWSWWPRHALPRPF